MTLRQLWIRFKALPHDAPLWQDIRAAQERRAEQQEARAIDDTLAMFRPQKGDDR